MPTEEIVQNFNDLRQDIVLLYELKLALATCDYELETLRHQYEVLNPGKVSEHTHTCACLQMHECRHNCTHKHKSLLFLLKMSQGLCWHLWL